MTHSKRGRPVSRASRRQFIKSAAAGAAIAGFPAIVRSADDRKIVIRDPGGPFTPGFNAAFYEPFTKASGITAVGVQGPHEPTGMIRAMIEAENYTWDMALLSKASHQSLVNIGYLEKVVPEGGPGPNVSRIPDNMRGEYIVGDDVYATVMVHRADTPLGKNPPQDWKDFWNTKDFPGVRSMHKHPFDTLEFALLADGVAPDPAAIYPIDADRAFRKLDEIKPEVDIWWTGGAQTSQLIKTGEVDLLYTWNGRAQVAIDDGAPAVINWNQAMWTFEGWCILKGGAERGSVPRVHRVRGRGRGAVAVHAARRLWSDERGGLPVHPRGAGQGAAHEPEIPLVHDRDRHRLVGEEQGSSRRTFQPVAADLRPAGNAPSGTRGRGLTPPAGESAGERAAAPSTAAPPARGRVLPLRLVQADARASPSRPRGNR